MRSLANEATSALDIASERSVTEAIAGLHELTTIAVAHRLATIKESDTMFSFADVVTQKPEFAR